MLFTVIYILFGVKKSYYFDINETDGCKIFYIVC